MPAPRALLVALLLAAGTASAELSICGPKPIKLAERLEIPLAPEAVSDPERRAGQLSLSVTLQNDHGCAWTLLTAQPPYLTDGKRTFIVRDPPAGPHFGACAAGQPLVLAFPLPSAPVQPLRLVFPSGLYAYSTPVGEFSLEVWKGLRLRPRVSVDALNRMFTVDASDIASAARVFRYERPGRATVQSQRPVWRDRLDEAPAPFDMQVTAILTNGQAVSGTARITPRASATPVPLADNEILVGLCIYPHTDPDESFYADVLVCGQGGK